VRSLGAAHHLILRNHGLLAVGGSVAQCFQRLWTLQRACEIQLASDAGAGPNRRIPAAVLERVPASRLNMNDTSARSGVSQMMFEALCRRYGVEL